MDTLRNDCLSDATTGEKAEEVVKLEYRYSNRSGRKAQKVTSLLERLKNKAQRRLPVEEKMK